MLQAPDPDHDALKPGTRLGEFEIECVLGMGGFGIVYRALDHALERRVAIKEYMPAALTLRGPDGQVQLRSPSQADTFELGRRSFINEARLLARFDHPSLVKVYRFWEANDTAYMVMPYYEGITLREARRDMPHPPSDAWLRGLLEPLLGALDVLHQAQVYHRDIAPDNILLLGDTLGEGEPRPVLLDFGAARHVIGDHTQTLTAIVKPSFAPIEQYAESAQLKQGPWTDIYALAAAVHYCITGRAPMPATTRVVHDELPPLSSIAAAIERDFGRHYTPTLLAAIDHALAVRPNERPASVAAWRAEINLQGDAAQASPTVAPSLVAPSTPTTPRGALASAATADAAQVGRTVVAASAAATDGSRPAVDAYATTAPAAAPARFSDAYARTMPDPFLAGHRADRQKVSNDQVAEAQSRLQEARKAVDQEPNSATWGNLVRHPVLLGVAVMLLFAVIATTIQRNKRQPDGAAAPAAMAASAAASAHHASAQQAANNAATSATDSPEKNAQATAERRGERAAERLAERAERRAATAASRPEPRRDDAPAELCAGRNFLTRLFCLKRECSKPEYRQHPQCVRLREQEEANRPRQP